MDIKSEGVSESLRAGQASGTGIGGKYATHYHEDEEAADHSIITVTVTASATE